MNLRKFLMVTVSSILNLVAINATAQTPLLSSSFQSTSVQFYRPFEENVSGQTNLVFGKTLKGECHEHSRLDNRSDAWKCQAGERTFDPCFIKTHVTPIGAVCPLSPWQSEATLLDLREQQPPPNNHSNNQDTLDMSSDDPWAIDLVNGTHCVIISHSMKRFSVNGQHVKYACDNQSFLLGHIQRCELVWKMLSLASRHSNTLNTVEIATAWY